MACAHESHLQATGLLIVLRTRFLKKVGVLGDFIFVREAFYDRGTTFPLEFLLDDGAP